MDDFTLQRCVRFLDAWLSYQHAMQQLPGLSVSVRYKSNEVYSGNYGVADISTGRKLSEEDCFRMASHSKTVTAVAILQLVEAHKLRLTDPLAKHLPWLSELGDARWQQITLHQILSHSAGIMRDGSDADFQHLAHDFPDDRVFRQSLHEAKIVQNPGDTMKYSNIGYSLLGYVIEAVSGVSYNDYCHERVFAPLGLTTTRSDIDSLRLGDVVAGHTSLRYSEDVTAMNHAETTRFAPALGLTATTRELAQLYDALRSGSGELLSDKSKQLMRQPHQIATTHTPASKKAYGYGLEIDYISGKRLVGHSGAFPGFTSKTFVDGTHEFVVSVAANQIAAPTTALAKGIMTVLYYFWEHIVGEKRYQQLKVFEGMYGNVMTRSYMVATDYGLVVAQPESFQPFHNAEQLHQIDGHRFRIQNAISFSNPDEEAVFEMKHGRVERLRYAGFSQHPIDS
jgi:D-alanyl-D-alanine carboxypeptidase